MPRRASASAVLLASVGACLRHLPPSLHSASVTPAPILFTICTQKPRQPQTMYLICTHVVCTRAHKIQPKKLRRYTSPLKPPHISEIHQKPVSLPFPFGVFCTLFCSLHSLSVPKFSSHPARSQKPLRIHPQKSQSASPVLY